MFVLLHNELAMLAPIIATSPLFVAGISVAFLFTALTVVLIINAVVVTNMSFLR
jgi:hypothetical protein